MRERLTESRSDLYPEYGADLIEWLAATPSASCNTSIRAAWRTGLRQMDIYRRGDTLDLAEMRRMMAEEFGRALAGRAIAVEDEVPIDPETILEGEHSTRTWICRGKIEGLSCSQVLI